MLNAIANRDDLKVRVLGIDPGTQNLGYSLGLINLSTGKYEVLFANTISVADIIHKSYETMINTHSRNIAMSTGVYGFIYHLVANSQPDWVMCESPYMNSRFPLPYALLTICTQAIQQAVSDYNQSILFEYIDPASAKNAVNVKGNNGDKDLMKKAVLNHPLIQFNMDSNLIDEHAIDSIAIGFSAFNRV